MGWWVSVCVRVRARACIRARVSFILPLLRTRLQTHLHTRLHTRLHTHTCTHTRTHTPAHTPAHTCAHTCTHTHTQPQRFAKFVSTRAFVVTILRRVVVIVYLIADPLVHYAIPYGFVVYAVLILMLVRLGKYGWRRGSVWRVKGCGV